MEQNNRKGDIMKNFKTIFLKAAVYVIGFTVLMLSIFWLPLMANETAMVYPEFSYLKWPVLLGMYVSDRHPIRLCTVSCVEASQIN